jgi:hypothetical protein
MEHRRRNHVFDVTD